MDSTTLLLILVPLVLGLVFNAVRFMRFIGLLARTGRRVSSGNRGDNVLSFDERVAAMEVRVVAGAGARSSGRPASRWRSRRVRGRLGRGRRA